ncbi:hypothetical protein B0H21DRAFT_893378 [Amylocystis lapponica]|nr:hypothetical protein B0H21DRAFT_381657 [Amylocystis lapponica]KAH9941454.1 hypothetical protein B0H21DRAFT_893378 [Amylocystis lapponica]
MSTLEPYAEITSTPRLPVEVCEKIVDSLEPSNIYGDLTYYRTLGSCALTCRALTPRSRVNLFRGIELTSRARFYSFAKLLTTSPDVAEYVTSVHVACDDLRLVTNFPIVFAHKLPRLKWLVFYGDLERDQVLPAHPAFYLAISTFSSVVKLSLYDLWFQTFQDFIDLVCSLPNLSNLDCTALKWKRVSEDPFKHAQYQHKLNLYSPNLDRSDLIAASRMFSAVPASLSHVGLGFSEDISEFLLDENISLARFPTLRTLIIWLSLPAKFPGYFWVPGLLLKITSPHVSEVVFKYQYDFEVKDFDFDKELGYVDHARIKEIFSRKLFSGLQRVLFVFRRAFGDAYGYNRDKKHGKLGERFSKMRNRGLLDVTFRS